MSRWLSNGYSCSRCNRSLTETSYHHTTYPGCCLTSLLYDRRDLRNSGQTGVIFLGSFFPFFQLCDLHPGSLLFFLSQTISTNPYDPLKTVVQSLHGRALFSSQYFISGCNGQENSPCQLVPHYIPSFQVKQSFSRVAYIRVFVFYSVEITARSYSFEEMQGGFLILIYFFS